MAYEYKGLGFSDEDIQSIENNISNGKLTTTITLKDGSTTISSAETALPEPPKSIPFITGTQTATTGSFTGTTSEISTLTDGQAILYWLPYNGSGNATLNLTLKDGSTTGAKNCYFKGFTRLTTQYYANTVVLLVYRENVTAGSNSYTGWWCAADYDYSTTNATTLQYDAKIKCGTTAITGGKLIAGKDGVYHSINDGSSFDITYPILYAGAPISAGATGTNNYLARTFTISTIQSSMTITAYKPLFIKGSLDGNIFSEVGNQSSLTQTIPTSDEDNSDYLLLGIAYSSTMAYLLPNHPIFRHQGGEFVEIGKSIATSSHPGLMSATDKSKLDSIAAGANNYTLPTATTSTLGGVKIGDNITISSGTISLTKTNVTGALGYTPPTTNTTYESKDAASDGTDVSLVTTGEKYTWNNKQDKLVSGTNIKTINGTSLLGNGNIEISGGSGGSTEVPTYDFGNLGNKEYNTWTYTSTLTDAKAEALKNAKYVTFTYVDSNNGGYIYKLYCWLVGENQRGYTKTYQAEYGSYVYTVLNKSYQTSGGIWQNLSFDITKSQKETGGNTSDIPTLDLGEISSIGSSVALTSDQVSWINTNYDKISAIKFQDTTEASGTLPLLLSNGSYQQRQLSYSGVYFNTVYSIMFDMDTNGGSATSGTYYITKTALGSGGSSSEPVEQETLFSGQYNTWPSGDDSIYSMTLDTSEAGLTHSKIETLEFFFRLHPTGGGSEISSVFQISLDDLYRKYITEGAGSSTSFGVFADRFTLSISQLYSSYDQGTVNYSMIADISPNWQLIDNSDSYDYVSAQCGFTYKGFKFANGSTY